MSNFQKSALTMLAMASAFGAPPDIDFGPSKRSKMKKWRMPGRTSPTAFKRRKRLKRLENQARNRNR